MISKLNTLLRIDAGAGGRRQPRNHVATDVAAGNPDRSDRADHRLGGVAYVWRWGHDAWRQRHHPLTDRHRRHDARKATRPQQPKLSDPPRARFWLIVIAVSAALLYLLAPVLTTPFLFAALLAYLGDPLIDRLEARKLSRSWRSAWYSARSCSACCYCCYW